MVGVQDLPGRRHIGALLGPLVPGQVQQHVQVVSDDGGLGGSEGLLGQTGQLLFRLLGGLLRETRLLDAGAVLVLLAVAVLALPQLLPDHLELLPQDVVPLVVGQLLADLGLDLLLQLQDGDLPAQSVSQLGEPPHGLEFFQDGLLIRGPHGDVLSDIIGNIARVLAGEHTDEHVAGHPGRELGIALKELVSTADESLSTRGIPGVLRRGEHLHLTLEERRGLAQAHQPAPMGALHHNAHIVSRQTQDLLDIGDGTHGIEVFLAWLLHGEVPLGHQEDGQALGHGLIQGLDGGAPAHVEVEKHIGKDGQSPERQHRHGGDGIGFNGHHGSLPKNKQDGRLAPVLLFRFFMIRCSGSADLRARPGEPRRPDGDGRAGPDPGSAPAAPGR